MSLRTLVFNALKNDATLNALGIDAASLYPNFAPDSPAATQTRFMVIRWGLAEAAPGRDTTVRPLSMSLWAYDREKDFGTIDAILRRARVLLPTLETAATGDGSVLCIQYQTANDDFVDPTYDAVGRAETYRIVASGT